ISKLYQHFRVRVTPTAYRILCVRFACFVRRSLDFSTDATLDTGWVASPYPTGTLTLQDAPSFSQRDSDRTQRFFKVKSNDRDACHTIDDEGARIRKRHGAIRHMGLAAGVRADGTDSEILK
ncbi:MAG: hypothetical protein ACREYE_15380, partial [Gammaproteobacteria bacterium]